MVEKLTGKELVIRVLEEFDEPMSCSEIFDYAIKSKYAKLYARGTDNDQKKAQISSLLSTWCLNDNCPVTRYDKGHDRNSAYTYVLNENVEDEDNDESYEEEYCEECGEPIDDCVCKEDVYNERYIDKKIKRKDLIGPAFQDDEHFIPNTQISNFEKEKIEETQYDNGNDDYETSNGKKIITRAQLPSGEVISWRKLLKRYNLPHRKGYSAHYEWDEYFKYRKGLPEVKVVSLDGSYVPKKPDRIVVSQTKRTEIWITHFGNVMITTCPCCKNVYNREIRFPTCYKLGHNEPHSKGGSSEFDNLIPICEECNYGMGNEYTVVEYRQILLGRKKIIE